LLVGANSALGFLNALELGRACLAQGSQPGIQSALFLGAPAQVRFNSLANLLMRATTSLFMEAMLILCPLSDFGLRT
jgi:hypothetical protein